MSNLTNQELRSWKAVEDFLLRRSAECHRKLSKDDQQSYALAILLQGMTIDGILTSGGLLSRFGSIKRWCQNTISINPMLLGAALKEWVVFFRNYIPGVTEPHSYSGFKHRFHAVYPFVGDFMSPIKDEVESFLLSPSPFTFTIINEHLSCISRLSLPSIDLESKSLEDYLATEEHLRRHTYDDALLSDLNKIIKEWFSDFVYEDFLPQHGPGAVANLGRCSVSVKYRNMGTDSMLDYFLRKVGGYPLPVPVTHLDRSCEVVFVPKSLTSWRTISMEPSSLQYYQQGIWRCLDRYLSCHAYLRHHVNIHDQSVNFNLAKVGSADRNYATIDLSAASDTVSWEMVKHIFAGTPLLSGFYATRSRYASLPNGQRIKLLKFAPMGSALCFPIECVIFCAVCEHVVRFTGWTGKDNPYSVYGDDIVIKTELAHTLVDELQKCGFIVNSSKSFLAQNIPFRESCGGEFFDGCDVTPFRLSRKFSSKPVDKYHPHTFQAHVDAANAAYYRNLKYVRLWFIHRLLSLPTKLQPIFGWDSEGLVSDQPTNFHLEKRWMSNWQEELLIRGIISSDGCSPIVDDVEESIRYFEWLRRSTIPRPRILCAEDVIVSDVSRRRAKLSWSYAYPVMDSSMNIEPDVACAEIPSA